MANITVQQLGTIFQNISGQLQAFPGEKNFLVFTLPQDLSVKISTGGGFFDIYLGLDRNLDGYRENTIINTFVPGTLQTVTSISVALKKDSYALQFFHTGLVGQQSTINYSILTSTSSLFIESLNAIQGEGDSGSKPFTFVVKRQGGSDFTHTVNWQVIGSGNNPANAFDFENGLFPQGFVSFNPGETTKVITVLVRGDIKQETDEQFTVQLLSPTNGASIAVATAQGVIENEDFIGTSANDVIIGTQRPDYINGGAGADTLTGMAGGDTFAFQFGQSSLSNPDRITDFEINKDKIDLLTSSGSAMDAPTRFTRATNSTATSLANMVNSVFTDANGALTGNQALQVNSAALVDVATPGIAGTYLVINNGVAGFQSSNDLLVNITGYSGALPALGNIAVSSFFV
jgi:Ca2+-binding RTX toxin-like protein